MQRLTSNVVEKMLSVLLKDSPSLGPSFVSLSTCSSSVYVKDCVVS